MIIQCDTRQKKKHHTLKEECFKSMGIELVHSKMLVGDYMIPARSAISVDTKANILEVYGNIIQDHNRFRDECILAQKCGIKLYIVIENTDGVTEIDEISNWKNPRDKENDMQNWVNRKRANITGEKPKQVNATSNEALRRSMHSMTEKYGVEFVFCTPEEAAGKVLELLEVNLDGGC